SIRFCGSDYRSDFLVYGSDFLAVQSNRTCKSDPFIEGSMATKRDGGLGWDQKKGVYFRSLGYVCEAGRYTQPKFYLGRDEPDAAVHVLAGPWAARHAPFLRLHLPCDLRTHGP